MELSTSMKIGIGVGVVAIGGFVIYKVVSSKTTTKITPATNPATHAASTFDINAFLDGTWNEAYTFPDGTKGTDELVISGAVINYQGKPEFDIVDKVYDAATKTLHLSFNRRNSTDKFIGIFTIDEAKKVMTGTENDGAIQLVWTKK